MKSLLRKHLHRHQEPVYSANKMLYHGTTVYFEIPRIENSNPPCDLGRGFYLTESRERAEQRAREKAERSKRKEKKYVLIFEFDDEKAYLDASNGIVYLKSYDENKEWLYLVEMFWDDETWNISRNVSIEGILIAPSTDANNAEILKEYRISPKSDSDVERALDRLILNRFGTQYYFGTNRLIRKYLTFVKALEIE